jgi:hypothetical protein
MGEFLREMGEFPKEIGGILKGTDDFMESVEVI